MDWRRTEGAFRVAGAFFDLCRVLGHPTPAERDPHGVKGALGVLERTLGSLEDGSMEPSWGQAIASVAKAIVVAYEAAAVSERLDALEAKVNQSATGTAGPGRAA